MNINLALLQFFSLTDSHILHNDGDFDPLHLLQREEHLPHGRAEGPSWYGPGSHVAARFEPKKVFFFHLLKG